MLTRSPHFEGTIGEVLPAARFSASNLLMDAARYDYEGNWAFCRFEGEEIVAGRFGFGRGAFDGHDYGGTKPPDRSRMLLHIELMTRDGAVLWLADGRYPASRIVSAKDRMDIRMEDGGREIFHIEGWPRMKWHMCSDDNEVEVHLEMEMRTTTILPDCVMPRNRFAMWLAIGAIECRARIGSHETRVQGIAFLDHPRTMLERSSVAPFGFYLYTPILFEDGSTLAGYYCHDGQGRRVAEYSFGLHLDPSGRGTWLDCTELGAFAFDEDQQPRRWRQKWEARGLVIEVESVVRATSIRKVWGAADAPKTRRENMVFPLVFDSQASVREGGGEKRLRGGGLAEFVIHPAAVEAFKASSLHAPGNKA